MKELREKERKIKEQAERIWELEGELFEKERKLKQAEEEIKRLALAKEAKRPKFPDYSLSRQERLLAKKTFLSPGRRLKVEKMKEIDREENVFPEGLIPEECIVSHTRIVTHLKNGQKEVVLYRIYRKGRKKGKIPNVLPRSEYGFEIVVALAFLIQHLGLSFDQASQVLSFFCNVELKKSEIDILLHGLSREWEKEVEYLSKLIFLSMVVYMDETGWKVGKKNCYTWIFTTMLHTVFLYGESRKEEVLEKILPWKEFRGIGVSDCLKIYENRFSKSQKCWAHFLRKAIKLMLLYPEKIEYKTFFDALFAVFSDAKKLKEEKISKDEKNKKLDAFQQTIENLCTEVKTKLNAKTVKDFREFVNLQKTLIRNKESLFTFVTVSGVEPTNNRSERGLRKTSKARNNYHTNKSDKGAKRTSVIATVMASLKQNLPHFSLQEITQEVIQWRIQGKSLFQKQLDLIHQPASP